MVLNRFSPVRIRFGRGALFFVVAALLLLQTRAVAVEDGAPSGFGEDIAMAPFEVNGRSLSISIHARSKSDRRYAEKFADEVVDIAYHTVGEFSGEGLVIVGAKREPHPILICRTFLGLAQQGQLHASTVGAVKEIEAFLGDVEKRMKVSGDGETAIDIPFDTFVPALPLPLEGAVSALYQIAWAERFEPERTEQKFRALTGGDFGRGELSRFDWVFYLPPRSASGPVLKRLMSEVMAEKQMGLFKRAATRSTLFLLSPVIRKAVEGLRKGMLYMAILRAESSFEQGDIDALTTVYARAIMPDLKPGSVSREKILALIDAQKVANAEYAKDPFRTPQRLATFDPAAYASYTGEYTLEPPAATHWFEQNGGAFHWTYKKDKPRVFYPAGDRLFVNEKGSMTIEFLVDQKGEVTGVEERWVRMRQTVPKRTSTRRLVTAAE